MYGNREGRAKTFRTFRASTKCREIGKAVRRLSLRSGSALNVGKQRKEGNDFPPVSDLHYMQGNREGRAKTFPTFLIYIKCREIGKARRRLSLRSGSAPNVGKQRKEGKDFPQVSDPHYMQGNREGRAKTFPTFPIYTKCRETRRASRRLFLRFRSAPNVGKQGEQGEDFPTFIVYTKCREIRKAKRRFSSCLSGENHVSCRALQSYNSPGD